MKYHQITLVITVILVVVGIVAIFTMPRSEDPRITVRQGLVYARYPGADEIQVEKQVTNKIEEYLFGLRKSGKLRHIPKQRKGR